MKTTVLNNNHTVTGIMNLTPGYWQHSNGDFYLVSGKINNVGYGGNTLYNVIVISGNEFYPVDYNNSTWDKAVFTFVSSSIQLDF